MMSQNGSSPFIGSQPRLVVVLVASFSWIHRIGWDNLQENPNNLMGIKPWFSVDFPQQTNPMRTHRTSSEALVFLPRTGTANWSSGADEGDGKARQGDGGCGDMVILSMDWFT
jgi:hypothetical protein